MRISIPKRSWTISMLIISTLTCAGLTWLALNGRASDGGPATSRPRAANAEQGMTPPKKAEALGIKLGKVEPKYLNHCVKTGKLLFTSGIGSKMKGRLGADLKIEDGYKAARSVGVELLQAVYDRHGTLDNLRVVKVLGCVSSTADFYDQPKVMHGCSDLFHEIFGAKTDGWHARSALGFVSLPNGCAVEIEAIFEIKD